MIRFICKADFKNTIFRTEKIEHIVENNHIPSDKNLSLLDVESVAEHTYGAQMLAISIYYQFGYKIDLNKVFHMLAIHELEEIEIGDLAFYETTKEDKLEKGKNVTDLILKDLVEKEEISKLLDEYNERKTDEAIFAYHCDKLECDVQMKLYDQEGCFDLSNQPIIQLLICLVLRKY